MSAIDVEHCSVAELLKLFGDVLDELRSRGVVRPFAPPESGRIAVKVINHYGDEVLKVFDVAGAPV